MWLLYKRGQHVNRRGSGQISSNSGKKDVLGAAPSTSDTAGSHNPADVLSALPSLVCVSQRVCDASHWKFRRDSDASENPSTLLLADKLLLLVRVIVASAIYTDPGSPHSPSSIGALNVTSAKLLRDLLTLTDSLTLAWSVVDMSAPHQKSESSPIDGLERLRDVLHSAIPERLLTLCRRLSPSDFIDVFNTEVMRVIVSFMPYCPAIYLYLDGLFDALSLSSLVRSKYYHHRLFGHPSCVKTVLKASPRILGHGRAGFPSIKDNSLQNSKAQVQTLSLLADTDSQKQKIFWVFICSALYAVI